MLENNGTMTLWRRGTFRSWSKNNRFRGSSLKCTYRRFRKTCWVKTDSCISAPMTTGVFSSQISVNFCQTARCHYRNCYLHSLGLRKFPFTYHVLFHRSVSVSCKTFQELQLFPRRRILIANARVRSQASSRGISDYQRSILTGFSPSTSIFLPVKYHPIYGPHSSTLDATQPTAVHTRPQVSSCWKTAVI